MKSRKAKLSPKGELCKVLESTQEPSELDRLSLETFNGKVLVEWDHDAATTPFGQLPFFIEYLKTGNLFEPWVEDCPLDLTSPNAPTKCDLLGTVLLSTLASHTRYANVTVIRNDGINPQLLGMNKIVSEDSLRRNLAKIDEEEGITWLREHLNRCYSPLLNVAWVLDVDTTVKTIFGHQEGANIGYNPHKPGRTLLINWVAKQSTHAGKSRIKISSQHGRTGMVQLYLGRSAGFFNELKLVAEQLSKDQLWWRILSKAVEKYLAGRQLGPAKGLT